ncbi:membrane protein [Chondromyces crocatus]|uniref:Membrane protein n=2 Tax=Chondromyces crocatus TaxID=52 RepID=A0A0K1EJN1_CHOCO|nr:membrane protein [Chondromyces crocatus]
MVPLLAPGAAVLSALLGSLFVGADTALNTLSTTRLGALIEQASGKRKDAYERIRTLDAKLRSRYLLGLIVTTTLTAVWFNEVFRGPLPAWSAYLAAGSTTLLCGVLYTVSATLGRRYADRAAPIAARFLRPLEIPLLVLAEPLSWISEKLGPKDSDPPSDPRVTEAEVEMLVEEVEKSGLFGREPAEMIRNVLEFADLTTRDVMIPRSRLEALEISTPIDKAVEIVTESGHSRYPVYKDQIDNIVGLLYAKDLFKVIGERGESLTSLREVIRTPANFVAESQPLSSLLKEMRSRRQHLAIVVDEFGGVSGIVTLEDVLEEIVGDIRDEHDDGEEPAGIQDLGDGRLVADGEISMNDLSAYLGAEIDTSGEHESLGGMLTEHLGKVPEVGTAVSKFGLRFIIRDSDERNIGKVEIVRPRPMDAGDAA